ncbi:MAG: hypothetical protein HY753_01425 [Nitrospirae bacterium]|nr:hypothetical protein [Nitrospirota bacterium]
MEEEKKLPKLQPASSQKIRIEPPKKNDLSLEKIGIETKTSEGEVLINVPGVGENAADALQGTGQVKPDAVQGKGLSPLWLGLLGISGVMLLLTLYILIKQVF